MCRNIKTLFNFEPPATDAEIRASCEQFVSKISGMRKPSAVNKMPIDHAVEDVYASVHRLLATLTTSATPRNREEEALKSRLRNAKRFA